MRGTIIKNNVKRKFIFSAQGTFMGLILEN